GSVGPYSLAWDFGDGGKGGGLAPSHTYAAGGVFSVSVVATDSRGCTDTIAQPNFITVVSTLPTFSGPDSVCVDVLANFANTTPGATNTTWDFDDGTTGSGSAITHVFAASGTYNVEMTTNISGCFKTVKKTVTVNPKPTGSISMSPSIPCPPPVPVTFSGSSSLATRYQWKWL